ncbi:TPA: hypothetical protein ACN38L_003142 [Vibrio parahaemolyticus]
MNDIKQQMKILIAKMHEYGFEEIAINNDVPAMDQEFELPRSHQQRILERISPSQASEAKRLQSIE